MAFEPMKFDPTSPYRAARAKQAQEILQRSIPFLERYKLLRAWEFLQSHDEIMKMPAELHLPMLLLEEHYANALQYCRPHIFTESAMAMHAAVAPRNEDTSFPDLPYPIWIEFEQPYKGVKGIHTFVSTDDVETIFIAVREDLSLAVSCAFDNKGQHIDLQAEAPCPYDLCQTAIKNLGVFGEGIDPKTVERIPCVQCQTDVIGWGAWMNTAMRMIQREYALDPEGGPAFGTQVVKYTEREDVTSKHGKPKRTYVEHEVPYTVIAYEVSEKPTTPDLAEEEHRDPTRLNWLKIYGKDALIYVRHDIQSVARRFPTRADGTRQDGVVEVAPHVHYYPMLREEARKKPAVYRVTARRYT